MPTTSRHDLPYPASSDLVKDGATAIQALAEAIDARLAGAMVAAEVGTETVANSTDDLLTLTVDDGETSNALFEQAGANTIEYVGATTVIATAYLQVTWEADGAGSRRLRILKNGTAQATSRVQPDADVLTTVLTWPVRLSTGDELTVDVWQNSGGALDVTAAKFRCVIGGVSPS
jgi:hypothetical protein